MPSRFSPTRRCQASPFGLASLVIASISVLTLPGIGASVFDWPQHDWSRPRPPIVDPGTTSTPDKPGRPPSDAVVLFDGSGIDAWVSLDGSAPKWVVRDGVLECAKGSGYIRTLRAFGDCQLHVEWSAPNPPEGSSQGRGNSGVFLMGRYEVQVLDSYDNVTYADGQAAAAYGQYPPLVNASRPPGQWQTYDILFTRPRFDEGGSLVSPARLTVLHNGVVVQHNVELVGPTGWLNRDPYARHEDKLPLALQDHGNPVRYRNLWVRELGSDAKKPEFVYATDLLDKLTGSYRCNGGPDIVIARRGALLQATVSYPGRSLDFPLHAESKSKFYVRSFDGLFGFGTNDQGIAESLVFRIGGEDRPATKVR